MVDRRAFAVNSLTYARGLARAARQAGVKQFCHSPATRVERAGGARWRVSTPHGEGVADTAFICTNAYSDGLWPGLARTVVPVRGYTAVSRPFEDSALDGVLPRGHFLTDTRHLWSGIRKVPGNRLHVGAGGPPLGKSARADLADAGARGSGTRAPPHQAPFPTCTPGASWRQHATRWRGAIVSSSGRRSRQRPTAWTQRA